MKEILLPKSGNHKAGKKDNLGLNLPARSPLIDSLAQDSLPNGANRTGGAGGVSLCCEKNDHVSCYHFSSPPRVQNVTVGVQNVTVKRKKRMTLGFKMLQLAAHRIHTMTNRVQNATKRMTKFGTIIFTTRTPPKLLSNF